MELHHGDCLEILPTIADKSVHAVITDPPYGIDFQSNQRVKTKKLAKIANDKESFTAWLPDAYRVTREDGCLLCFCRWDVQEEFRLAIVAAGYAVKSQVIWDKMWHGMGDLDGSYAPVHEILWFATKGAFAFPGGRPISVIRVIRIAPAKITHPNEKPVNLLKKLVTQVTKVGDTVLDPFMGGGSTGVASGVLNRNFIGIELDAGHYHRAERRIRNREDSNFGTFGKFS